jgi:hypothetical protein
MGNNTSVRGMRPRGHRYRNPNNLMRRLYVFAIRQSRRATNRTRDRPRLGWQKGAETEASAGAAVPTRQRRTETAKDPALPGRRAAVGARWTAGALGTKRGRDQVATLGARVRNARCHPAAIAYERRTLPGETKSLPSHLIPLYGRWCDAWMLAQRRLRAALRGLAVAFVVGGCVSHRTAEHHVLASPPDASPGATSQITDSAVNPSTSTPWDAVVQASLDGSPPPPPQAAAVDAALAVAADAIGGTPEVSSNVDGPCMEPSIDGYQYWLASGEGATNPARDNVLIPEGDHYVAKISFLGAGWHVFPVPLDNDPDAGMVDLSKSAGFTVTYSATADLFVQFRSNTHWDGGTHYVTKMPSTGGVVMTRTFSFAKANWTYIDNLGVPQWPFESELPVARALVFIGLGPNDLLFTALKVDGYLPRCRAPKKKG